MKRPHRMTVLRLAHDNRGLAAMEFALCAPLLFMLFMGSYEVSRYILIMLKVEKTAYTIADVVAQSSTLSLSQMNQYVSASTQILLPYPFGTQGRVIVSSVYQNGAVPPSTVRWQYSGGGTLARSSQVGVLNGAATLPAGMTLVDRENIIIAEVYYRYEPYFTLGVLDAHDIYRTAIFKPRLGALTTPPA